MTKKLRLAVLLSGGGTNLQALLDKSLSGKLNAEVVVVASDRPGALGLARAERAQVPTHIIDYAVHMEQGRREWAGAGLPVDLEELDKIQKILRISDASKRLQRLAGLVLAEQEIIRRIDPYQPDYIILAGFMRLLSPYFLRHYNRGGDWRVLNIHPALLPAFPGQHGYEDTFRYGVRWGGITVHFADEGEDTGPILAQAVYPIWPEDDVNAIRKRGLELEHDVYAQCINWLALGQIQLLKEPGGHIRVKIMDPRYPEILKNWVLDAFAMTG